MNFYKHHLGDYDGATAHLSWDEDMAYTRLLRVYYRREKPITTEEAYRLIRAQTRAHRVAVDSVLREFFEERTDGWHNKRADEEIAAFKDGDDDRERRKVNERERQRRHRLRRKELFEELRQAGIVPAYDTSTETLSAMAKSRVNNAHVTRDATANQNHKPEPDKSKSQKHAADAALDPLWGRGLQVLTAAQVPVSSARSFIAGCLKEWPDEAVADALAEAAGTAEPRAYVRKLLAGKEKKRKSADPFAGAI